MSDYAVTKTGQIIEARDYSPDSKVECFCQECKDRVTYVKAHKAVLRGGTGVFYNAMFRHRPDSPCSVEARDRETEEHLNMKAAWLEAFPSARQEVSLPSGRQADLVVTSKRGRQFSVECQHSTITPETVRGRMVNHNQDGLFVDFNFSSRRLKNYQLSLEDGVFEAIDASAFRTIELDEQGQAAQAWVFFDMRRINAPQIVKVLRPLKDINLVGVVDRGYQVIAPENDLDLLRWQVKGKMETLLGRHESFLENWDRAKADYDDPIVAMERWSAEERGRMHFKIPDDLPGSQLRVFCEREEKKEIEAIALQQRSAGLNTEDQPTPGVTEKRQRDAEKWVAPTKQEAYPTLASRVDEALAAGHKTEVAQMLGAFRVKLADAIDEQDEVGITVYGNCVTHYTKQVAAELAAEAREATLF